LKIHKRAACATFIIIKIMLKKIFFIIAVFTFVSIGAEIKIEKFAAGLMETYNKAFIMFSEGKVKEMVIFLEKEMLPPFPFDYEPIPEPFQPSIKLPDICQKSLPENIDDSVKKSYKILQEKAEKARKRYEKQVAEKKQKNIAAFQENFPAGFKTGFYFYELLGRGYMNINPAVKGHVNTDMAVEAYNTFRYSETYMPLDGFINKTEAAKLLAANHYFNLAWAATTLNRDVDAGRYCNYALTFCPTNNPTYADLSVILSLSAEKDGDFKSAADIYGKLYKMNFFRTGMDYIRYAKMLFRLGKERKAFKILDDGLIMTSVNSEDMKNDIVFNSMLERITLATDEEIYSFYQTLGDMIEIVKLKAGMEESVAYIIKERNLLTKIFYFLTNEKDLKRIRERIKLQIDN